MIGHGEGVHSQSFCLGTKFIDATGSVEETVVCMDMKVNEIGFFYFHFLSCAAVFVKIVIIKKKSTLWKCRITYRF